MDIQDFIDSVDESNVAKKLNVQQQALWWDSKGDWRKAHDLIDQLSDPVSAHIHAYLHRVEGDLWNARYWYSKAKKVEFAGSLQEEWESLVRLYS